MKEEAEWMLEGQLGWRVKVSGGDAPRQLEVEEGFNEILFRFGMGRRMPFRCRGPF